MLFVLGLLSFTAATSDASAAVTVGSSLRERADLFTRCDSFCTELPVSRPGGLAGATIPSDGVLTRWRIRAATRGWVRLRILRPDGAGGYTPVAASEPMQLTGYHAPGQDVRYEFPAQIPVRAGDVLALDRDRSAGAVFHSYGGDLSYSTATFAPALGDAPAAPAVPVTGRELLLNADVQLDGEEPIPPPSPGPALPPIGGHEGPVVQGEGGPIRPTGSNPTGHGSRPNVRPRPRAPRKRSRRHAGARPTRADPPRRSEERTARHGAGTPTRSDPPVASRQDTQGHRSGRPRRGDPPTTAPDRPSGHGGRPPRRGEPDRPRRKRPGHHRAGRPRREDPPPGPKDPTFEPH